MKMELGAEKAKIGVEPISFPEEDSISHAISSCGDRRGGT